MALLSPCANAKPPVAPSEPGLVGSTRISILPLTISEAFEATKLETVATTAAATLTVASATVPLGAVASMPSGFAFGTGAACTGTANCAIKITHVIPQTSPLLL
eukprot:GHVS01062197.1.p2 GENE.GHVS01062197.1~~GHVS01062197.1.p2  ORF type:complete len:104 (-),score=8.31 GHVS01062197.1:101-412(-)